MMTMMILFSWASLIPSDFQPGIINVCVPSYNIKVPRLPQASMMACLASLEMLLPLMSSVVKVPMNNRS